MNFIPHEYQKICIDHIKNNNISVLLLDMGLGKTVITLTALNYLIFNSFDINKVLIIAPLRVASTTWPAEIKKWEHLKFLNISTITGNLKNRIKAVNDNTFIYTVNRENVKWLVEYYIQEKRQWDFNCVVIDELSSFKNYRSERFKYLKKIRPFVKKWIGLTGTPTPNGLMDLWAEIGILDGGERLGKFITRYREAFFTSVIINNTFVKYALKNGADKEIYNRIADITLSMKALDYLKMPECLYIYHDAILDEKEEILYQDFKHEMIIDIKDTVITAANAGVLTGKLLQLSNGAIYTDSGEAKIIHNKKIDILLELIEAANEQPVLIAYWFKHDKDRIVTALKNAGYNPVEINTPENIMDWNKGKITTGLIHPASAGHGLNLQSGGHVLIWFGLTWSLELYQQTNARLWRQGQNNTVTIHHILTKNTIDYAVLKALKSKDKTQENLLKALKAELKS